MQRISFLRLENAFGFLMEFCALYFGLLVWLQTRTRWAIEVLGLPSSVILEGTLFVVAVSVRAVILMSFCF